MRRIYQYKGRQRDKAGIIEGQCQSLTLEAAIDQLTSQGIILTHIKEKSIDLKSLLNQKFNVKVSRPELIILTRQMYSLIKAGISVVVAVRQIANAVTNTLLSEALQGIEKTLLAGKGLGIGLANYPKIFPPIFVELVQVGEESGHLEEAFLQISNYLVLEYNTSKQLKTAIRYPMIVLIAVIGTMVLMNLFVVPKFAAFYGSFHTQLPIITQMMINSSSFFKKNIWYMLLIAISIFIAAKYYLKTVDGKLKRDYLLLKLPVVGSLFERIIISRFARTLMIVFRAGIPLGRGMTLLSNAVGNSYVKNHVLTMQRLIEKGENLSQAVAATHFFSPLVIQMISAGEESGTLDNLLQEVAEFYEREIGYDLESLGDKIEPILLIFMGGMVLMLAVAVFLPMWDIYQFART